MNDTGVTHNVHSLSWYLYTSRLIDHKYKHTLSEGWNAEIEQESITLPPYVSEVLWQTEKNDTQIVFENHDLVGFMNVDSSDVRLHLGSDNLTTLKEVVQFFKDALVPLPSAGKGKVQVKFWYHTMSGEQAMVRTIDVPQWLDIRTNYSLATRDHLESLMTRFKPAYGGQLILWHGDPGAGKTYALRSLCEAWKDWCTIEYITDPEAFFGGSPSYLMNLLSGEAEGDPIEWDDDDKPLVIDGKKQQKWKLIIMEDAGDFLALEARNKVGQALSRLLNVSDGFIGQGLKILILITTNEELGALHPAVARPGRSASIVSFDKFTSHEARTWAQNHNIDHIPSQEYSLAELYALLNKFSNKGDVKKRGFGFAI